MLFKHNSFQLICSNRAARQNIFTNQTTIQDFLRRCSRSSPGQISDGPVCGSCSRPESEQAVKIRSNPADNEGL